MDRRRLLQLGLGTAAVLGLGGGFAAFVQPGLQSGRLTDSGRLVFRHVARGALDGLLPQSLSEQSAALDALLARIEILIGALPGHARSELSQLLALLGTGAGRRFLANLPAPWPQAGTAEIQQALQQMRISRLTIRRQAYQALHDITASAWFSDPGTWTWLGYPGPLDL